MRLLIVDDSKTMRSIIASFAAKLSFETVQAEDGAEALRILARDCDFEAVLIDWDMPRMTGIELLRAIRSSPEYDGLKTMMITSQSGYDRLSEALTMGADDYLMKPIDEAMFEDKLRLLGLVA